MQRIKRFRGALLGLAAGDALGTTLEFRPPGSFVPLGEMLGGGPFSLEPGQWTDDTSMALCLAESLCECQGFDPVDQLRRYLRWYQDGHFSSTGVCFDIGGTVRRALERFRHSHYTLPWCGDSDPRSAGNGSLMRLAPVPMFYARRPAEAIAKSADSSRTTHGALTALDACRYFGGLLVGALDGADKTELLSAAYSPLPGLWQDAPLCAEIAAIAQGSYQHKQPPAIKGTGYVVDSLEAALWAFYHGESFAEGALLAVNLGDDADTTGAIYGQLAGAFYGEEGIPAAWRARLSHPEWLTGHAERLYASAYRGNDKASS
jgi:ADP-ribosylglycohydrolase